ncbi:DNA-binding transcriptional activator GcvA [Serratia rubidaea]|uniref:DNA-binding transcriptional activator GcvA n=1 Tax=Serratia rubidaea TaxID=61652 RepID=A0A3S4H9P7_SERRU|nr:DNA-binding transcriptional activator GcvA [Serratia rubidaea]
MQELYLQAQNAPIVLSCEPTLLMRWLIPRMPEFLRTHPAIHVQLVAGGGAVAFQDGITLAIRRNDFDWGASVHSIPLFSEKIGPVCKPEMLAQFVEGSQTEPRLRRDAALLQTATRPDAWADWAQAQGSRLRVCRSSVSSTSTLAYRRRSPGWAWRLGRGNRCVMISTPGYWRHRSAFAMTAAATAC